MPSKQSLAMNMCYGSLQYLNAQQSDFNQLSEDCQARLHETINQLHLIAGSLQPVSAYVEESYATANKDHFLTMLATFYTDLCTSINLLESVSLYQRDFSLATHHLQSIYRHFYDVDLSKLTFEEFTNDVFDSLHIFVQSLQLYYAQLESSIQLVQDEYSKFQAFGDEDEMLHHLFEQSHTNFIQDTFHDAFSNYRRVNDDFVQVINSARSLIDSASETVEGVSKLAAVEGVQ